MNLKSLYTQASYPKMRVWFGIISIGWNLLLPWMLYFSLARGLFCFSEGSIKNIVVTVCSYFVVILLLHGGWDFFTGFFWEKRVQRYAGHCQQWVTQWLRSALTLLPLQCCGGLMLALIAGNCFPHQFVGEGLVGLLLLGMSWSLHHWHFRWIPHLLKQPYLPDATYQRELEKE
jgi:hypothetical protein